MKSKLIKCLCLVLFLWVCLVINSHASIFCEEQTVTPGQEFTIQIKSDISLGSYTIEVQDVGIFEFVTSAGQEGSGKKIITGSTTMGTNELANFTFKVSKDETNTRGQINIRASGMETPNLDAIPEQELNVTVNIKQDTQSDFIKEVSFGESQKKGISFLLKDSDDNITQKDLELAYPGKKIENDDNNPYLKNGSKIRMDGTEYTVIIYGDANCDGNINILDAVTVLNKVRAKIELSEEAVQATNKVDAEDINILDAVKILNVVKGKMQYKDLLY